MCFLGTSIQKSAWWPFDFDYNSLFVIIYTFIVEYLKCYWRRDEQQLRQTDTHAVVHAGNQTYFGRGLVSFQGGCFVFQTTTRQGFCSKLRNITKNPEWHISTLDNREKNRTGKNTRKTLNLIKRSHEWGPSQTEVKEVTFEHRFLR